MNASSSIRNITRAFALLLCLAAAALPATARQRPGRAVFPPPGAPVDTVVAMAARVVPTPEQYAWQQCELIAFLHFGMNTFTNREWGDGTEDPALFNPSALDAREWIGVLKEAGFTLAILTAKHHDGFCLWPSRETDHTVAASPWRGGRGDLVREVADACREAGMKFGIYLSPWDRHEPSYGDSPRYNEFFRRQLRELLSGYGEIAEIWFDGANGEGAGGRRQEYDWASYYRVVRELQPGAVIFGMGPDVRWVGTETGIARETEWSVVPVALRHAPGQRKELDELFLPGDMTGGDLGSREKIRNAPALAWYPAEADVSIRPGWFHHPEEDARVKSPEELVDIYYHSVGRNAVLLVNVPPDRTGRIADPDRRSLAGMRTILERTFADNLVRGAVVSASSSLPGHGAAAAADGSAESYWTAGEESAGGSVVEMAFPEERTFDRLLLQEAVRVGQRIEEFRLDAWRGDRWSEVASGTTVGFKRLLRFPEVSARRTRLVILRSRTRPTLSEIGLFKAPPEDR